MFCNSPVDKLLALYLGATSKQNFKDTNIKLAVFEAVKLRMRESDHKNEHNTYKDTNKVLLSLEDIIIL